MRRVFVRTLSATALAGLTVLLVAGAHEVLAGADRIEVPAPPEVSASQRREIEITFYADRARRDPLGAADRSRLSALYLDRARETGSFADLQRAEALARESLALREAHNAATYALLAATLMAQHRFDDALRAAKRADALEPGLASHRALIGEIALEVGDYDRARTIFDSLRHETVSDLVSLRIARWYELTGRIDWAEQRIREVLVDWQKSPDAAPSHLAWLHLRLAELAVKEGRLDSADSQVAAGRARAPEDYRLLGLAARLAARRGRWRQTIELGERAVAVSMEPATLGVLSDAYAMRRDTARAAEYAAVMQQLAFADTTAPHRAWSLWLLDHDRDVMAVLARATRELRDRRDIYGWDVHAWALHKSGRQEAAWRSMREALRTGARDPMLDRHANTIRAALDASRR